MKRVYNEKVNIDEESIKRLYAKRSVDKKHIDIDAPVVLCGDKDKRKIEEWTSFEVENRLPLLKLDKECRVLELGFGTGRISKYITPICKEYVGIDYVEEFIDFVNEREDITKDENTFFLQGSFSDLVNKKIDLPVGMKFNRFIISGGVFIYINDDKLKDSIAKLVELLDDKCILYISESVAIEERLTLNKFYSDSMESEYSAIYRTCDEYDEIFEPFYKKGFKKVISEEFFYDDIKLQKETKQWIFIFER